ncbi:MAG: class I SAM-dependent methyltransferase, partial [Phycisphaerae bacterium]|nr:class I SAM-dependent methyltransferase [Phycisphaerae bacterium]
MTLCEPEQDMDVRRSADFYNAAGVCEMTDPASEASAFAVQKVHEPLAREIRPGMRTLDLGCNAGRFCFAMEEMGAVPVGIDCANVPLEHARLLAAKRGSRCRFVLGDLNHLPFGPDAFDLAVFPQNIIEHSYDAVDRLAARLTTVLRPGGKLCVSARDELLKHGGDREFLDRYDAATGRVATVYTIPGKGEFEGSCHFWTAAFAVHVIGRRLRPTTVRQLPNGLFWLVFVND